MVRRALLTGVLGLAASLAACAPSDPDPAARVTLTGAVLDAAGAPLPDARVTARLRLEPQQIDSSRLSELDALGFACIDERPPPACADHRDSTQTEAGGDFSLDPATAPPATLLVTARRDAGPGELSGPAHSRLVAAESAAVDLGAVTMWTPGLVLTTVEGADAVLQWEPAPPGDVAGYRVLVEDSTGRLVWQETADRRELRLHLPNLAGTRGGVSVVAMGADASVRWRSARVPYRADDGTVRPASVEEVGWPVETALGPGIVLAAIVALFGASLMLVLVAGARHRHRLALIPVLRGAPGRR